MRKCLICDEDITDGTNSGEHLIPESIGGRRKVSNLLHMACNSNAGDAWDCVLSRQLHPLSILVQISRHRGKTPPLRAITTAGESITIEADGGLRLTRPEFRKEPSETGGTSYRLTARTLSEAREMLEGLRDSRHPGLDVEAALAGVEIQDRYLDGAVIHDLGFGGEIAGRSIVKSCVAMAFASGIDWSACDHAVSYLRNSTGTPCFGYFHSRDLVIGRAPGLPLHCLAVKANRSTGLVLAYAEYFGIHRVVACLGDGYMGPDIEDVYAIDPRDGSTQNVNVVLDFQTSDFAGIYNYEHTSQELMRPAVEAVVGPAMRASHDKARQSALLRAFEKAMQTCGAEYGKSLTEEQIDAIAASVAQDMAPMIMRQLRPLPFPAA